MRRIRVGVVDDHPLYREGVVQTLHGEPDFEIVGQGGSADDAIRLAEVVAPGVLLLDLTMPGNGLDAIAAIVERAPDARVLVLTASGHHDDLSAALERGACGYALKGLSGHDLRRIVRAVAHGERYVPPALAANLPEGVVRPRPPVFTVPPPIADQPDST